MVLLLEFLSADGFGFRRSRGFMSDPSFLPSSNRALRTRTLARSTFGTGWSSARASPWIQQSFNGGRSTESTHVISSGRGQISSQERNSRRPALRFSQDNRGSSLLNTHHRPSGTTSRERSTHSIHSIQPNNFIRERSVLFPEHRPRSNVAAILRRIRMQQQNGKSSKESVRNPQQPLQQSTHHRTISFLQNRQAHSNSKEVRGASWGTLDLPKTVHHRVVPFLDRRHPPQQAIYISKTLEKPQDGKTSKEVRIEESSGREAKLRKLRQLMTFIPQNQKYDFLIGLKAATASKTLAEKRNLKNTKYEYPQKVIRERISLTPRVSIKTEVPQYQPDIERINKKKTSEEKKEMLSHKRTENSNVRDVQRILLLQKLNSFLRQQLNNEKKAISINTNVLVKDKNKSKEVANTNLVVSSPKISLKREPEMYLDQRQHVMSAVDQLNPHRHRLQFHNKLGHSERGPSVDFTQLVKKPVHSPGNSLLVQTKQPDLQNISPFSKLGHSFVLVNQNDLNTSKEQKSSEKDLWVDP